MIRYPTKRKKTSSIAAMILVLSLQAPAIADTRATLRFVVDGSLDWLEAEGATRSPIGLNSLITSAGGDLGARTRVTSNASWVAARAEHDTPLGAVYATLESGIRVDGGGTDLGSRNTAVGIWGSYGNVFVGQWDTPYKEASRLTDPFYRTGLAGQQGLVGSPGFFVTGTTRGEPDGSINDATFHRRQGNSVQYWTPSLNGLAGRVAYSADEATTERTKPTIWSAMTRYDRGRLHLSAAYEVHNDYFGLSALTPNAGAANTPTNSGSEDRGLKVVAGLYLFGRTAPDVAPGVIREFETPARPNLSLVYEKLEYENDDTAAGFVNRYERDAWYASLWHKFGNHKLRGMVGLADSAECSIVGGVSCRADELGTLAWAFGYSYHLDNTELYITYVQYDNEAAAQYTTSTALRGFGPGADPWGVMVGVRVRGSFALLGDLMKSGWR